MMKRVTIFLAVMVCAMSVPVNAMLINIDYGNQETYSGPMVVGSSGDVWNQVMTNTVIGLVDSAGGATDVSVIPFSSRNKIDNPNADATIIPLVKDWVQATGPKTVTFGGLVAGEAFALYIYGGQAGEDSYGGEWSIVGGDDDPKAIAALYASNPIPFAMTEGANYVVLTGNVSEAGQIVVQSNPSIGTKTILFGMQLEMVPEPATLVLFGLGGLLVRKRR